jgi:hypothetical protein
MTRTGGWLPSRVLKKHFSIYFELFNAAMFLFLIETWQLGADFTPAPTNAISLNPKMFSVVVYDMWLLCY